MPDDDVVVSSRSAGQAVVAGRGLRSLRPIRRPALDRRGPRLRFADEFARRAQQFVPETTFENEDDRPPTQFNRDKDDALWIDFVADLGDRFDATFAIASLLSQEQLKIDEKSLPRGQLLVMGGDEVYPTPK
ncbi:hypothetical protein ABIA06_003156 [Bradyrhizobium yuanmingense]|uniref:hypothetical protein n=1 Tax=Bradyrhizobium yuanmingense TaxID=108015 RepID=UPI0035194860